MSRPKATAEPGRRSRLLATKLAALAGATAPGGGDAAIGSFALGAALVIGDTGWVLLDDAIDDGHGLGAAIVWAHRAGTSALHVVADTPLTVAARRAGEFTMPIAVSSANGRDLVPVEPAPVLSPPSPPAEHLRFVDEIAAAGAAPVVEHGVVTGEVRGLEVCRVVDVDTLDGRSVRLEVGTGAHDRDAFAIIHGDVPTREALAGVVNAVAAVRTGPGGDHPLNRLAPERLLRWRLENEPWLLDMAAVEPSSPPVPRPGLKRRCPAAAIGTRLDGSRAVIVCSVGVDLDVIPYAADVRLAFDEPGVSTMVVLPARDLLPVTRQLAALLRQPVTLVALPAG